MTIRPIAEDSGTDKYPIRPKDIDTTRHFLSAFGKGEVEVAAQYVVRFCQKLGGWKAFTKEDLNKFYLENGGAKEWVFERKRSFPFHWLNDRLLVKRPDGRYCVTDLFIDRCFNSSPKRKSS